MITIAHISDLHFGRENPRLVDGLIHSLEAIQPQLVVISGDLTQRARKREFLAARSFLESLPWPILVTAGNHDIPAYNLVERFHNPWHRWSLYLGYEFEPIRRDRDYIAIGINTVRRAGSLVDWSRGRINHDQIGLITKYLNEEEDEKLRIIVAHHPFWLPGKYHRRHTIGGRDMALEAMQKAGVDIILSGHVHSAYTHLLGGVIVSHVGTAFSNRLIENSPNSFKIVHGDRRQITLETWEWTGTSFSIAERQVVNRIQGAWMYDN